MITHAVRRARRPAATALQSTRGVSALEFAFVAPVIVLALLGAFDLGNAIQQSMRLESAARAGAQRAFAYPSDRAGIVTAVRNNLPADWTDVTVRVPARVCKCDDGTTVDCSTGICAGSTASPITYISVTVTRPFSFASPFIASLLPSLTTLTGNVEIRL